MWALNSAREYELFNIVKCYSPVTADNIKLICKYLQKHKLEHKKLKENGHWALPSKQQCWLRSVWHVVGA